MSELFIGVLSDTHGLLRPEALAALRDAERLVHAGDVGAPDVLAALRALAPLHVVRGNNDHGVWADTLPEALTFEAGGVRIHVRHDVSTLALDLRARAVDVLVCGHSHQPHVERRDGVLHVNPGSCGPRRFRLPVTVARLHIVDGRADAELVPLRLGPAQ